MGETDSLISSLHNFHSSWMLGTFSALSASLHLCVRLSTEDFRLTVSPLILIYIPALIVGGGLLVLPPLTRFFIFSPNTLLLIAYYPMVAGCLAGR